MRKEIMICGVDCEPGSGYCNNYCNHDTTKPMPDHPLDAPSYIVMQRLVKRAEAACDKADEAVETLRLGHNELFAEGIIHGVQSLADSCERRREKLKLLAGNKTAK
jgi:hypothetical protein